MPFTAQFFTNPANTQYSLLCNILRHVYLNKNKCLRNPEECAFQRIKFGITELRNLVSLVPNLINVS